MRKDDEVCWSRRTFLRSGVAAGAGLAMSPWLAAGQKTVEQRPNIVFILADDLGPDGLGCYGSELYKDSTPRIDALAAGGVRFTHCYATGICSPTRAQYATGQYPFRNGVLDIDGSHYRSDPNKPMLTQMLKDAGYVTGKVGKADLCASQPDEVLRGWQYWEKDVSKWKLSGPSAIKPDEYAYFPEAAKDFTLDFIGRNTPNADNQFRPFYFLFGFNNPHVPLVRTPDSQQDTQSPSALYKDNIEYIDKVVGAIVDKLRDTGQLENTMILFSGDNGSLGSIGGERLKSRVWDPKSSRFRDIDGGKADRQHNREGTALVPLVVHWPGGIAESRRGTVLEEFVDFSDFLPTFAHLAGAEPPDNWLLDGHSFLPLLLGDPAYQPRAWVYHQIENNWCVRGPGYRLNRDGRFFDMSDAPFSMKEIQSLTPEQSAIRESYQSVLDQFDPANGPSYEGHQDLEWDNPAWEWKKKHFGGKAMETPTAGDYADPDGDGVPNIFERAFGWDPKNGSDKMPEAIIHGTKTELTVPQIRHNDVEILGLGSEDGQKWSLLQATGDGPFTFSGQASGGQAYRIRLEARRITPWKEP